MLILRSLYRSVSLYSLTPHSFRQLPHGKATAEETPPLPIQTFSPCFFKSLHPPYTSAFTRVSFIHLLLFSIIPSSKWTNSPIWILNITQVCFFHNLWYTSLFGLKEAAKSQLILQADVQFIYRPSPN